MGWVVTTQEPLPIEREVWPLADWAHSAASAAAAVDQVDLHFLHFCCPCSFVGTETNGYIEQIEQDVHCCLIWYSYAKPMPG